VKRLVLLSMIFVCLMSAESAAYWSSGNGADWESVPRIIYGPGDENAIRERLNREPYKTLYARLLAEAGQSYDLENHDTGPEQQKANIAGAAAFIYAMNRKMAGGEVTAFDSEDERLAYGRLSETLLAHMYTLSRMQSFDEAGLDILTSQELLTYATAYDTLRGAAYVFEDEALVRENIVALASDFYKDWTNDLGGAMNAYNENHMSKSASAMGVAAIVMNGYEPDPADDLEGFKKPEEWIKFAVKRTEFIVLDALISREGAYAEGPYYYSYTAINHEPFMRALNRYTGGAGIDIDGVHYDDLYTDPRNALIHDWMLRIRMPDGTAPAFDDGSPGGHYAWGVMGGLPHSGLYSWAWQHQPQTWYSGGSINQAAFTIAAYDDSVPPESPDEAGWSPTQILFDGGQAVFRQSWEPDSTYLLLAAEHGKAAGWSRRKNYDIIEGTGGHDHNDPGHITLHAFGKPLLIDGGYLGWPNHEKVCKAENHNILLVDDRGPELPYLIPPTFDFDENGNLIIVEGSEGGWVPGDDGEAYIIDSFDGQTFDMARVRTRYFEKVSDTEWTRTLIFARERYFVVFDEVEIQDGSSHKLTMQWHGNGGGTSGGQFDPGATNPVRWTYGDAGVDVFSYAVGGFPDYASDEKIHDAGGWAEKTHSRWLVSIEAPQTTFASVLFPFESAEADRHSLAPACAAAHLACADVIPDNSGDGPHDRVYARPRASEFSEIPGCEGLSSDGEQFASFCDPESKDSDNPWAAVSAVYIGHGSSLKRLETDMLSSDRPFTALIERERWGDGTLHGHYGVDGGGTAQLEISGLTQYVETRGLCCTAEGFGMIDSGDFEIAPAENGNICHLVLKARVSPQVEAPNPWNPIPHVMQNETVDIDISPSCNIAGELEGSLEIIERPWYSSAVPDGMSITPDYPGDYILKVSATDDAETASLLLRFHALPAEEEETEEESEFEGDGDGEIDAVYEEAAEEEIEYEAAEIEDGDEEFDGEAAEEKESEPEDEAETYIEEDESASGCNCRQSSCNPAELLILLTLTLAYAVRRRRA